MNEDQLKEIISRVSKEVTSEVKQAEVDRGMNISELRDHAKELGGGKLDSAWVISYDTSGIVAGNLSDRFGPAAWTISYDTSGKVGLGFKNVK